MEKEIINGVKKSWNSSGQLWGETPFVNGKAHGLAKYWHDNKQLWYETTYRNDLQCGAKVVFRHKLL